MDIGKFQEWLSEQIQKAEQIYEQKSIELQDYRKLADERAKQRVQLESEHAVYCQIQDKLKELADEQPAKPERNAPEKAKAKA